MKKLNFEIQKNHSRNLDLEEINAAKDGKTKALRKNS